MEYCDRHDHVPGVSGALRPWSAFYNFIKTVFVLTLVIVVQHAVCRNFKILPGRRTTSGFTGGTRRRARRNGRSLGRVEKRLARLVVSRSETD